MTPDAPDRTAEVLRLAYYRRSTAITTNRAFKDWPKVFPDALNAQVIAERLTERAERFVLDGWASDRTRPPDRHRPHREETLIRPPRGGASCTTDRRGPGTRARRRHRRVPGYR